MYCTSCKKKIHRLIKRKKNIPGPRDASASRTPVMVTVVVDVVVLAVIVEPVVIDPRDALASRAPFVVPQYGSCPSTWQLGGGGLPSSFP
jgi:hypothetical protein